MAEDLVLLGMLFADDLSLFSTSQAGLQRLLDALHAFCKLFLLEVNASKTEIIVLRKHGHTLDLRQVLLLYDGLPLRVVQEAKYLGLLFHEHGDMRGMELKLISAGRRACFALQARLKHIPALSIAAKLTLLKNLVLPVLTYGCQVWAVLYLSLLQ